MLTRKQFFTKLKKARKLSKQIEELKHEILGTHDLTDIPFEACNAENLGDPIQCYIDYDEPPMSGDVADFWAPYKKAMKEFENDRP